MEAVLSANTVKQLETLKTFVAKNGVMKDEVVKQLMDLRPRFIENNEPLCTRITRLTAEYIDHFGYFDLNFLAEEDEEGVVDDEIDMDGDDSFNESRENFLYLLDLLSHPENQINKEELQRIKQMYLDRDLF
jgi:hypothetical protein